MELTYNNRFKYINIRTDKISDAIENVTPENGIDFVDFFNKNLKNPIYKKVTFYIVTSEGKEKVSGWKIVNTDYVLHKKGKYWTISHYPTGLLLKDWNYNRMYAIENTIRQIYVLFKKPQITEKYKIINTEDI